MSDLLRPGAHRAAAHLDDSALLSAMLQVEQAWLDALVSSGVAPRSAAADLAGLVEDADLPAIGHAAETGGNPVIPLVELLRERTGGDTAAWLHRGLTSQDVLDTALAIACGAALDALRVRLVAAVEAAASLTQAHRGTQAAGRTLTRYAVPVPFGLTAAQWLAGLLDAHDELAGLRPAVQVGGAAGTRSALVQLAGGATAAEEVVGRVAERLGMELATPWHTVRTRWTRLADAVVRATDACGHVAADVLELGRSEVAEVAERSPGGSSTMPGKRNPVLATLVRAQALTLPSLAAQLHRCAADMHSQRPAGAWHAEWWPLRELVRGGVIVVDQTADLLAGLDVDVAAMRDRAEQERTALTAERDAMARLAGNEADETYVGQSEALADAVLERARRVLGKEIT